MGGIVCQILHNSTVTVSSTDPAFDMQIRRFFSSDEVAQSVVNDTQSADTLCSILAKAKFDAGDRAQLNEIAQSLWGGYK
jgi:hypothetical protein